MPVRPEVSQTQPQPGKGCDGKTIEPKKLPKSEQNDRPPEQHGERRLHAKVPAGFQEPSREKQSEAKRSIRAPNVRKRWQRESLSYGSRARTPAVIRFQRRNSSV